MADKTIYVISDLHMGDGGPRDNFGYPGSNKPEQLRKFLDFVEEKKGELLILGDLFDFWQANVGSVLVKRKYWLNRFADMKATYVVGNHDIDLQPFIQNGSVDTDFLNHRFFGKMDVKFQKTIAGKKFMFMHGHEVDPFNLGDAPSWGRILSIFAGIFEDKNGSPMLPNGKTVEEDLEKIGELVLGVWKCLVSKFKKWVNRKADKSKPKKELTPAQNPNRISELLEKYRANRENEGYDITVVGHTHQAGKLEDEDWYFNSGSWVKDKNEFLTISPEGEIKFYQWRENQAQRCEPVIKRS